MRKEDRKEDDGVGWLRDWIQRNDDKHEEAHSRIRLDHRELDADHQALKAKVATLELLLTQQVVGLKHVETAPVDVGKLVGNWKVVLVIAGMISSSVAGNWFVNAPIRESQAKTNESISVMRAEFSGVKDNVDDLKKQMEMRRLEIQQINNNIQQLQRSQK